MAISKRSSRIPSILNQEDIIKKQQEDTKSFLETKEIKDRRVQALLLGSIGFSLAAFMHFTRQAAFDLTATSPSTSTSQIAPELCAVIGCDSDILTTVASTGILTDAQCMCLSFLVFTVLIAVKRTISKREADFRVFYHVKQQSASEYEETTRQTTAIEVEKLLRSQEYQQMLAAKGESEDKWNWQTQERRGEVEEFKSPVKRTSSVLSEEEDAAVEKAFIRVDAELKEEKNLNVLIGDYKRKRIKSSN